MTESFLHYVWHLQYFRKEALKTSSGETIRVIHPGNRNSDAGPDFSNAQVKIDELEWRGSVEIHIKASGWNDHKHSSDEAYEKVILHVVWENDKPIKRTDGSLMPTLELKPLVSDKLWERYKNLYTSADIIPCANSWSSVPDLSKLSALDNALMSRLKSKASAVNELFSKNGNDWEQTCYQLLSKNFGFSINAEPMLRLAEIIPYQILLKHLDKPIQIEAMLFGVGGFLEEAEDDEYVSLLRREYNILRKKYSFEGKQMNLSQWKFLRLRPANFPTIRIAQFAALLTSQKNLFSKIREAESFKEAYALFDVEQSAYWQKHYQFGKESKSVIPALGNTSIHNLIINTVVPLLVAYGKIHDEQSYINRTTDFLQSIPAEDNKITRLWHPLNYKVKTAFDSQALIELYNNFCRKRRCLECGVGSWLIKSYSCTHACGNQYYFSRPAYLLGLETG